MNTKTQEALRSTLEQESKALEARLPDPQPAAPAAATATAGPGPGKAMP